MSVLLLAEMADWYPWLVALGVFGLVAALAWVAFDWITGKSNRAEERLDDFRDPRRKRGEMGQKKPEGAMSRMLEQAAPKFAKPLQPKTEKEQSRLKLKLGYAGFRS